LEKYVLISIVCFNYFLFTYQTSAPVPSFVLLQEQFAASYTQVNWTFAVPALGLAVGPLFCSALGDTYGRRMVMIGGTCIALIASGCTSLKGINLSQYMAARFFQGFGSSPAATVGLSIINDISFEHERGFRIGLWVMAIDLGIFFGAMSKSNLEAGEKGNANHHQQSVPSSPRKTNTGSHITLRCCSPSSLSFKCAS
jgi:MFS family permease